MIDNKSIFSSWSLDKLFYSKSIQKGDNYRCPECMEVEIHRDRFRQLKEGGWDVLKENKYPKFKPICNKCLSEGKKKISDNYIKKKISTSTEAKNPKKYLKSKKNNCLTSSKKPDKPSLKSSLKKFKFKLSPADKVRIKAKSVLKKYKK